MNVSANISAMQAAAYTFQVSAHNVANVSTDNFKALEAQQAEGSSGAPYVTTSRSDHGTDIAREMVNQMQTTYDYKANAQVVRTADEMTGHLIDLLA